MMAIVDEEIRGETTSWQLFAVGAVALLCFLMIEMIHSQHLLLAFWQAKDDKITIFLNFLILLFSSFVPFLSIIMGPARYPLAVSLFGILQALISSCFWVFWVYLQKYPHLSSREHDSSELRELYIRNIWWIVRSLSVSGLAWAFWSPSSDSNALEAPQIALG